MGAGASGTSFLIEDVACPVDKLADMTTDLVEMFEKHGYKDASCFGHALEGNLHLVFSQVPCNLLLHLCNHLWPYLLDVVHCTAHVWLGDSWCL